MDDDLERMYAARFDKRTAARVVMWQVLTASYFQQFVDPGDTVLDLAAGHCGFINAIDAKHRIAVDLNVSAAASAAPDVEVLQCRSTELPADLDGTVDVVWVSNFLEHLRDKEELFATLEAVRRVLHDGGRVLVLQPNIRIVKEAYWDFVDHTLPLTEKSLAEALELCGFRVELLKVRFLPYTTESRFPMSPALIRLYLKLPIAQLLLGQQTFAVARRIR